MNSSRDEHCPIDGNYLVLIMICVGGGSKGYFLGGREVRFWFRVN